MDLRDLRKPFCTVLAAALAFCPTPTLAVLAEDAPLPVPQEIPLPPAPGAAGRLPVPLPEKTQVPIYYKPGALIDPQKPLPPTMIRGPREVPVKEPVYIISEPDFYGLSLAAPLPTNSRRFIEETLIPGESVYFLPGTGFDTKTAMPYDHVRVRLKENLLSEVGNYTAASKLSLLVPFLLKVIQKNPSYRNVKLKPEEAAAKLRQTLRTLLEYNKKYPDYGGFLPWVDIRPNGTIAPASTKVPSLDNGQLTWALAAVVASLEDSSDPELRKIASMAQALLHAQDYKKFYDPKAGLLHGTIQYDTETREWHGDATYYLNDMFEGTLAVLWGVLNGQIPEDAWDNLAIPTIEYITRHGEKVTTFAGFRASFHEHWALAYLPIMSSALAPLYQNFLYAQADHARRNFLPGFISTAYDPQGVYRQMGVPSIAYNPVDRSDVAVLYATAMSMLISPTVGAAWLAKLYAFKDFVTPYGGYESVGRDGYADIFTADAKGMTLLASSGGVVDEINKYLGERTVPRTGIPMNVKLIELLHAKYKQMLAARDQRPVFFPTKRFPAPPEDPITVRFQKPPDAGDVFDVTAHLQAGHLHGKNVRSVGLKTLEQDVAAGKPFQFEFDIPAYYAYFDQWAFRGTYIDRAVRIADMRYVTLTLPVHGTPAMYELELKSDDITLATVVVKTTKPGKVSEDGAWKTIVERITPIPESDIKPFNYVSVAIHDPRYLLGDFTRGGRDGTVVLKDITLFKKFPFPDMTEPPAEAHGADDTEFELIRYWRLSHGALPFTKNAGRGTYRFTNGLGWRGGYIPFTNLSKFRYLYVKARNVSDKSCGCFYVELKHESDQLLGGKTAIHMLPDKEWRVYEIPIPPHVRYTFNYVAVSDPYADFELGSLLLAPNPIAQGGFGKIEKVPYSPREARPLECTYRPCPAVTPDKKPLIV